MKLLVLAQTPPPVHGQSLMVQALIDGLPGRAIEIRHVQMRLSEGHADIGSWRIGKIQATIRAAFRARRIARREGCDALYYVPAPAKRGAFYRDLVAMAICRSAGLKLILHWHAPGLGEWVRTRATRVERSLALRFLGGADLSIVLSESLRADAEVFLPRRTVVVANGIPDPGPPPERRPKEPFEVLFMGLGSREKGLFDTLAAVALLEKRRPGAFRLTFAGAFPGPREREEFLACSRAAGPCARCAGFLDESQKRRLLAESDAFCLPTCYPGEGQPLALMEAMAFDLPIITTRWRGIPEMLPPDGAYFVGPGNPAQIAAAIEDAARDARRPGALRGHFLDGHTIEQHLDRLRSALLSAQA